MMKKKIKIYIEEKKVRQEGKNQNIKKNNKKDRKGKEDYDDDNDDDDEAVGYNMTTGMPVMLIMLTEI